ncbi:hypothetical protein PCC9214_02643 [Planktothrix tepida]|uniref:DUF1517 domain-containing protein n=1 Tax=Planktothrix tepida PCC 9214 TaxID=671072 RepID=A0A1J1LJL8_9CYAN|nr:DUF1517 domain-containing protein [Planktothrix tepida]CAD5952443.1 hypothetical protein PCC9214_02643 [Planktothrix tepida]CUR32691.1 conserved hypothetical protein [Planktothrix tepida PCC 9214]
MAPLGDRFNRMIGKTRFVVSRLFLHLGGDEVAPLLGVLNQAARNVIEAEGDLEVAGEALVQVCQSLLQYDTYWQSGSNEGDVVWNEGEAADYFNELFTDSGQRYLSEPDLSQPMYENQPLSLPITHNLVVMITIVSEGEVPDLETDLASMEAMNRGLKALINLHYQGRLRGIQIHFSPARLGDELTNDQLLQNFPELIPL